jgi:hypothetical protein
MKRGFMHRQIIHTVFFVFVLQGNFLFAFDFDYTSQNADAFGFFHDEMTAYIRILESGQNVPFYYSAFDNLTYDDGYYKKDMENEKYQLERVGGIQTSHITVGTFYRVNEHLLLPLNAMISFPISDNRMGNSHFILNSGLVFQTGIGTIGFFVGHDRNNYRDEGPYTKQGYDSDGIYHYGGQEDSVEYIQGKAFLSLASAINVSEFPIAGYIIKMLEGYINTEQNTGTNYSIKLVSQPFSIGSVTINNIKPYYSNHRFNLLSEIRIYGLLTNIEILNKFSFFVDFGYKNYYNTASTSSYYEDTPYFSFGFPAKYFDPQHKNLWMGFAFYFDKRYLVPKISYIYQIINSRGTIEIGLSKFNHFEILIAVRANFLDKTNAEKMILQGKEE